MKKFFGVFLILCIILSGCGSKEEEKKDDVVQDIIDEGKEKEKEKEEKRDKDKVYPDEDLKGKVPEIKDVGWTMDDGNAMIVFTLVNPNKDKDIVNPLLHIRLTSEVRGEEIESNSEYMMPTIILPADDQIVVTKTMSYKSVTFKDVKIELVEDKKGLDSYGDFGYQKAKAKKFEEIVSMKENKEAFVEDVNGVRFSAELTNHTDEKQYVYFVVVYIKDGKPVRGIKQFKDYTTEPWGRELLPNEALNVEFGDLYPSGSFEYVPENGVKYDSYELYVYPYPKVNDKWKTNF